MYTLYILVCLVRNPQILVELSFNVPSQFCYIRCCNLFSLLMARASLMALSLVAKSIKLFNQISVILDLFIRKYTDLGN